VPWQGREPGGNADHLAEGPWLMITDSYNASTCTTGLYSSATIEEFKRTTDFLKTSKLKPFELKVLNEVEVTGLI
jgi:hypothetical protein